MSWLNNMTFKCLEHDTRNWFKVFVMLQQNFLFMGSSNQSRIHFVHEICYLVKVSFSKKLSDSWVSARKYFELAFRLFSLCHGCKKSMLGLDYSLSHHKDWFIKNHTKLRSALLSTVFITTFYESVFWSLKY